jgi:hypothetical protein
MPIPRAALCLLILLPAGCADWPALFSLRAALNRELPDTPIGLRLTDESLLTVTIGNSPLQQAPCEARVARALRIANLVREHYPGFTSLRLVNIDFASPRSGESMDPAVRPLPIRFSREAISAGLSASDSVQAVGTCRTWEELQ